MGELGLFYRLAPVAFIGGSLVAHGGQNPLEPARLGCAVLAGPHMENFTSMTRGMEREGALLRVRDAHSLAAEAARLLGDAAAREALGLKAQAHVRAHEGTLVFITRELRSYLA
jgi:3-deoxy-D-manno-octulosonic-acid transferase